MNALLCAFTENVLFFKKRLFAYVCTKLCEEEKGTTFRTENAFVFLPSTLLHHLQNGRNVEKECAFEVKLA